VIEATCLVMRVTPDSVAVPLETLAPPGLRVPLVAGETPTPPLECLVAAADSASGVAVAVDPARATFVNGDLTIALHRAPVGEWMCLDAATTGEAYGIGLARARLWDTAGLVGRSLQTLLLEPRAGG
jgi:hypothetical protein